MKGIFLKISQVIDKSRFSVFQENLENQKGWCLEIFEYFSTKPISLNKIKNILTEKNLFFKRNILVLKKKLLFKNFFFWKNKKRRFEKKKTTFIMDQSSPPLFCTTPHFAPPGLRLSKKDFVHPQRLGRAPAEGWGGVVR